MTNEETRDTGRYLEAQELCAIESFTLFLKMHYKYDRFNNMNVKCHSYSYGTLYCESFGGLDTTVQ
jgi:hypothetical protein